MTLDLEPWNQLLQLYVNDCGRVDYQSWQNQGQHKLCQWLRKLSDLDLANLTSDQRLALWLNLYNALTIAQVLKNYPLDSIFPKLMGIPNLIAFWRFFQRSLYQIGGKNYSLNRIEHGVLRREFRDPRIHFALVCASVGCPWLRRQAYFPELVHIQLNEDAHRFINNPNKVIYCREENLLYLNPIFRWYRQDFLQVSGSVVDYLQIYLDIAVDSQVNLQIRYLDYDWSLNALQ